MLPVGDEVEVVGELDVARQLLEDVDAESLAAQLGVRLRVAHDSAAQKPQKKPTKKKQAGVSHDERCLLQPWGNLYFAID